MGPMPMPGTIINWIVRCNLFLACISKLLVENKEKTKNVDFTVMCLKHESRK